ncbi:putative UDP-glucuronosyltransferase ugt-47 [Schistocerca serialis cubense]|uniref:putative UDP-glucuronosyltransferase ugt-47 n=1 Tax=Schistocerca serialis cubense TaxID=2023355 RepID=UPI00214E230A|nr:putative UDP-glucuronosyltransferase ugt-47 [Schistocerca serialis cubense]
MLRAFAFSLLAVVRASSAAKILVIAPTPSISHQLPFHILSKALLWRGYRVTILMTDSMKISHENYTEIDLSVAYRPIRGDYDFVKIYEEPPIKSMNIMQGVVGYSAEVQLNETSVQSFIRSGEPYDLEILEGFIYVCYYGLVHKMGSPPVVKLLTLTAPSSVYYNFGSAMNPAFMPDMWLGSSKCATLHYSRLNKATYHAIPLLAIPFFGDQAHNAAKVRQSGTGVWLEYSDVTNDTLLRDIRTVVHDSKYRDSMRTLSSIFREHRVDSLERAVWWLEYVIRHKGALHLRSAAIDLHWWQRLLLDVVAFMLVVAAIAVYLMCISFRRLVQLLLGYKSEDKS